MKATKKPTHKEIEKAKKTLEQAGYLFPCQWHTSDIDHACELNDWRKLTKKEKTNVLADLDNHFSAEVGINWRSIETAIQENCKYLNK